MPSQVVLVIEKLFPDVLSPNWQIAPLSTDELNALKGIVNLVREIPNELITVPVERYADLVLAMTVIDEELAKYRARQSRAALPRPGNVNVLTTIHSVMKGCSDEFPASNTADLSFVTDIDLRESIRRDIGAIERAIGNAEWKAANVLAGAAIEALLLWKLSELAPAVITSAVGRLVGSGALSTPPSSDLEKWSLHPMIEVAREVGAIADETCSAAHLCNNFRNLIHPGRGLRLGVQCNRGTAFSAVGALDLVVSDLSRP